VPEIWKAGTEPGDSLTQTLAEMSANALPHGLVEEIATCGRVRPSTSSRRSAPS
jgi:hypothetical protein